MKNYIAPTVALRGDIVRETLGNKSPVLNETSAERPSGGSHLSFGL